VLHRLFAASYVRTPAYSVAPLPVADFIQNCVARRAFRLVFARGRTDLVPAVRPRRVDAAAWEHERGEWARYHAAQSQAEADHEDESTWPVPSSVCVTGMRCSGRERRGNHRECERLSGWAAPSQ